MKFAITLLIILLNFLCSASEEKTIGYYLLKRPYICEGKVVKSSGLKIQIQISHWLKENKKKKNIVVWHNFALSEKKNRKREWEKRKEKSFIFILGGRNTETNKWILRESMAFEIINDSIFVTKMFFKGLTIKEESNQLKLKKELVKNGYRISVFNFEKLVSIIYNLFIIDENRGCVKLSDQLPILDPFQKIVIYDLLKYKCE